MRDAAIDPSSELPNEYLYGRAGYLYALLYVNKHIHPSPIDCSFIRQVRNKFPTNTHFMNKTFSIQ